MRRKTIDFGTILGLPDKQAITAQIVEQEINQTAYRRVSEWFAALQLGCPTPDEVERIAEAKATRDLIGHHRGVVNATYQFKAGRLARYAEGERVEVINPYHRDISELLRKVVSAMVASAAAKAS